MPNNVTKPFLVSSDLIATLLSQFKEIAQEKMEIINDCLK
jgi:hypothetical protein